MSANLEKSLNKVCAASRSLRSIDTEVKNKVILSLARLLFKRRKEIVVANKKDLAALAANSSAAFRDRLMLDDARIASMASGLEQLAKIEDPVGEIVEKKTLRNGLLVRRVRSPLGVIFLIFESRPNVAVESFALAFKSGNALIARGGKESTATTAMLFGLIKSALAENEVETGCLWGITDPDRKIIAYLLKQVKFIDVVIPRGGEKLITFVRENSEIPILKNDRGMCHIYVDEAADLEMAINVVLNAKTQRPGVCNAAETVLVHQKIAGLFLPKLAEQLERKTTHLRGCLRTLKLLGPSPWREPATEESWDTEYLDLVLNCKIVDAFDDAISHINAHGSKHSEAIITRSKTNARKFQSQIDAAAVYWNASTRFTDGFELGLGGEIGISTQKLHVRGPVGLRELTSARWIIDGTGQTRESV